MAEVPENESVFDRLQREMDERKAVERERLRERREQAARETMNLFSDEAMVDLVASTRGGSSEMAAVVQEALAESVSESVSGPVVAGTEPETDDASEEESTDVEDGAGEDTGESEHVAPAVVASIDDTSSENEEFPEDEDESYAGEDENDDLGPDDDDGDGPDDEDRDDFYDDFDNWDNNPFVAQEAAAEVSVDAEDLAEEPEDLVGLAEEQRERYEAEEQADYERKVAILRASANENAHLDGLLAETLYPSRNPEPMPADRVELREDRPSVAPAQVVKPKAAEPLKYSSTPTTVKLPTELIDYIRAVVVETLQSTVTRLDQKQLTFLKGRIGSEAFATMSDQHRVDEWIKQTGQEFAANRLVTVFVAANANLDVAGLDPTSKLVVEALRRADPTLREMHAISAKLDAMHASHEKTRSLSAYNNRTLRALEYAVSFIIAYFIPGGYVDLQGVKPTSINVVTRATKTVRDRLLGQTEKEIIDLQFSENRRGA